VNLATISGLGLAVISIIVKVLVARRPKRLDFRATSPRYILANSSVFLVSNSSLLRMP
jgi:hypothetical protein